MHNISTECLFSFITNPPGGYPPEIHRNSTGNPPEMIPEKGRNLLSFGVGIRPEKHWKQTEKKAETFSGRRAESFKF